MKVSKTFDSKTESVEALLYTEAAISEIVKKHRRFTVTIENAQSQRTEAANRYYWGVLIPAFQREWPDYTKDEVHYTLGERFRTILKSDEVIKKEKEDGRFKTQWRVKSTKEDSVMEFWIYCEQCTDALAEIGGQLDSEEYNKFIEAKKLHANKKTKTNI